MNPGHHPFGPRVCDPQHSVGLKCSTRSAEILLLILLFLSLNLVAAYDACLSRILKFTSWAFRARTIPLPKPPRHTLGARAPLCSR